MTKWCPNGLFLAAAMVLITFAACSQRKVNFSTIEFGAGPSLVTVFDNDSKTQWTPRLSGAASMGLIYAVKRNLSVTTHAMVERKGSKLTYGGDGVELPGQKYSVTTTYISLAPGVRRYLADSGFFIEGGVFVAFLLDWQATPADDRIRPLGSFATVDAGVSGAIGVTPYRTKLKGWNFRLVNNLGLTDANHRTGTKELTNSLSLIAGLRLRMR